MSDEARGRFRTEWRRDARTQGASFGGSEFPLFTSREKITARNNRIIGTYLDGESLILIAHESR
ncbi:hypothetical protein [Burkholderia contaminans]|uniref:hypothetical protein n=1 Tax=Burkholderia contaminans TaxID=488447 RepID=UPI000F55AC7A|nr:hypothetical protein [Burkholderia contaminans]